MVGRTITHFQIVEKIGEGGMGVVYKARDGHLNRFVAIKVLPPERVADPERRVTDKGRVNVLDFGPAKLTETAAASEPAP